MTCSILLLLFYHTCPFQVSFNGLISHCGTSSLASLQYFVNFLNWIFILDIFVFLLIFLSFIPECSYLEIETVRLSWASFL